MGLVVLGFGDLRGLGLGGWALSASGICCCGIPVVVPRPVLQDFRCSPCKTSADFLRYPKQGPDFGDVWPHGLGGVQRSAFVVVRQSSFSSSRSGVLG